MSFVRQAALIAGRRAGKDGLRVSPHALLYGQPGPLQVRTSPAAARLDLSSKVCST